MRTLFDTIFRGYKYEKDKGVYINRNCNSNSYTWHFSWLAIPRFTDANEAARGAKLLGDMRTIESMALVFAANNGGKYPKVTTTDKGYTFAAGSEKFNNYFASGYPLPPKGFLVIQGNNGSTYRYDLSGRQYYYGYNSQQRDGVDFQFATCDGKSIYEFLEGKKGNNGGGPV
nr:hypothetical protein [uncultured Phascolarctobacterium sp.]